MEFNVINRNMALFRVPIIRSAVPFDISLYAKIGLHLISNCLVVSCSAESVKHVALSKKRLTKVNNHKKTFFL